jgi:signal peptidase I
VQTKPGPRHSLPPAKKEFRKRKEAEKQTPGQFFRELPVLVVVALVIAVVVKTFVVQAFFIPSQSMENTLLVGDRVLVAKFLYRFSDPKYPDVVVFSSPVGSRLPEPKRGLPAKIGNDIAEGLGLKSSEQDFIKRVIATEGQTVEVKVGSVFVDGKQLNDNHRKSADPMPDFPPTVVPKGQIFVMGDNRNNSEDSRFFGPIPRSTIVGRAFVLVWPFNRVAWLAG